MSGTVGLDIEVKDETARTIVEAALDLFSPVTESVGWLGDSIRVHRTRSTLRCFKRTKELAEEAGLTLVAPPVKFLSQYIENCSLEEEDDETLIEWWARLLVDAGREYQSKHVYFSRILKQLSAIDLELLEVMVRNGLGNYRLALIEDADFGLDFNFLRKTWSWQTV